VNQSALITGASRGWTEWTQGFQYGSALLQFDAMGDERFLEIGRRGTVGRMAAHVTHTGVHDHGFNNISTYGNLLRLMREGKIPHNEGEKNFYELALKASGAVQAARWTKLADGTGFIPSFNGPHSLFVDAIRSCRSLAVAHQLGHVLMGEQDERISLLQRFVELCGELGVKILNISAGSPYYNPHIQRPAAYPPSDGYQPAHDPLIDVARQINVVRQLKARAPRNLVLVGTAYSYLQEYLPHVAQFVVRHGWTDMIGLGRMMLSYPELPADATTRGALTPKLICRTFSDCTTAPRNGLISGCYPLDKYYSVKPEFQKLKEIKSGGG
jgi:hypothetical protein